MERYCCNFKKHSDSSIIPIGNQIGSSADCDNSLISITSKLPIAPYIRYQKYNSDVQRSHQEILKPASLLFKLNLLLAAKMYKAIDKTSIPKKNAKFPKTPWQLFQPIKILL
jgi:hypothetical protein